MSNKSINSFLIEKGYIKNDEQITVLKMVELVDEWQEQMQQEKNLNIDFVSQQRELLIEAFDLINIHDGDREKINKLVDITLKSINCG